MWAAGSLSPMTKRLLALLAVASIALALNGCLAAAAGAAAGYIGHKEGYRVQSPIKKQ